MLGSTFNNQNNEVNYCTEAPKNLILSNTIIQSNIREKIIDFSLLSKDYQNNLNALETKSIIPGDTQCISEANFAQGTIVQNYCVETTTQALIVPPDPEFSNVPQIQLSAQENANSWLSGLNNEIIGINTGLKQFCNLIITYKTDMDQLVDDVVADRSGAKDNFLEQIGFLRDYAEGREQKIKVITVKLGDFRQAISQDGANFKAVKNKADIKYDANTGEMAVLRESIYSLQASIQQANAMIAGGATTAVIGAGVSIIGGGSGLLGVAIDSRNKASAELSKTYVRYNTLQQTCTLLEAINTQLTSLLTGNEQSVRAVHAISLALGIIAQNLSGIIENINLIVDNVEAGRVLKRLLNTFVANAESLKTIYVKYEETGILPVQPTKKVWNNLFPYRAKAEAFPDKPISMQEYAYLIGRKLAWERHHSGLYVPQAA